MTVAKELSRQEIASLSSQLIAMLTAQDDPLALQEIEPRRLQALFCVALGWLDFMIDAVAKATGSDKDEILQRTGLMYALMSAE